MALVTGVLLLMFVGSVVGSWTPSAGVRFVLWSVVPAQAISAATCAALVRRLPDGPRRRGWSWVLVALALNVASMTGWLVAEAMGYARASDVHSTDVVVFLIPGVAAIYWFYRAIVGRLRLGLLLDALSLTFAIGAAMCFALVPPALQDGSPAKTTLELAAVMAPIILPAVAAGMLYVHVNDWSRERSLLLLLAGALMNLVGDFLWIDRAQQELPFDAMLYTGCFIVANGLVVAAFIVESRRSTRLPTAPPSEGYSLLPVLIALGILVALVAGGEPLAGTTRVVTVWLIVAALATLLVRELRWRRELARSASRDRAVRKMIVEDFGQRASVSHDMHEGLAQELSAVAFSLAAAQRRPETLAQTMPAVLEQLRESVNRTRELASAIAPLKVARGSLSLALRAYLDARARLGAGECALHDELNEAPVAEPVGEALYMLAVDVAEWLGSQPSTRLDRIALHDEGDVVLRIHTVGPSHGLAELDVHALGGRIRALGGEVRFVAAGSRDVRVEARVSRTLPGAPQ